MVYSHSVCKAKQSLPKSSFSILGDLHQSSEKSYEKTECYSAKIPLKMVIDVNQFQFCLEYSFRLERMVFSEDLVKGGTLSLILFFPDFRLQRIQVFQFDVQFSLAVLQRHEIFDGGVWQEGQQILIEKKQMYPYFQIKPQVPSILCLLVCWDFLKFAIGKFCCCFHT